VSESVRESDRLSERERERGRERLSERERAREVFRKKGTCFLNDPFQLCSTIEESSFVISNNKLHY